MNDDLGWMTARQRDGGIDRIPVPEGVPGSLWLCGKHAIAGGSEHLRGATLGWTTIVCLTERHELEDRYPEYVRWLERAGEQAIWWPIPDLYAPPVDAMLELADDLADRLRRGDSLLVHCGAGIGRAGTTAVCVLIRLGVDAGEAQRIVGEHRPMAGPEVGPQRDLVRAISVIV